ncbi:hypothetical protein TRAPUB_12244 [Trametes pubescens]|uniref:Uncharacterized protein n=1 Tax=Trametes pubescens TaxID=154538 RepID=A0A1M2VUF4_TRAPU|nr:hypothetical protein TRAPUB_12244 [Trametes pubescens]
MATLYMRVGPDAQDLASMVNPTIPWVLIVVDGPKAKCTLMLPTCERECLEPEHFEDWIGLIQGPTLTACDATEDQRNLLLHIALAYYGLVGHSPEIDTSYYYPFIARLTVAALALAPDEDAETELESIVEELRGSLPMTLFEGPHVPPITEEEDERSFNWILPDTHSYEARPLFVPNLIPTPTTAAPRDDQAAVDSDDDLPPLVDHDDQGASGAEWWGA